jgi:hypothetical protein
MHDERRPKAALARKLGPNPTMQQIAERERLLHPHKWHINCQGGKNRALDTPDKSCHSHRPNVILPM